MEHIQQDHQIWNHFDELGLLIGITRKPGEPNFDLQKRILDSYKHVANSSLQGLTNALNRDFGFETYNVINKKLYILDFEPLIDYPITISVDGASYNTQVIEQLPLPSNWILPSGLSTPIPPTYTGAVASGLASSWILWRDPVGEYTRLLEFMTAPETNASIKITYSYRVGETIYQRTDQDFTEFPKDIDEIYNLEGVFTGYKALSANPSGHIRVFALNDSTYISNPANGFWTIEGTATDKLEALVDRIREAAPILWGEFVADDAFWDAGSTAFSGIESLPNIFDANISGFFRSSDDFYSDFKSDFQSGIGYGNDLYSSYITLGHLDNGFHTPKSYISRLLY